MRVAVGSALDRGVVWVLRVCCLGLAVRRASIAQGVRSCFQSLVCKGSVSGLGETARYVFNVSAM